MADKLIKFYEQAKQMGGFKAQLRLAMITKIPSPKAEKMPDSQESIKLFEKAILELKKEFK